MAPALTIARCPTQPNKLNLLLNDEGSPVLYVPGFLFASFGLIAGLNDNRQGDDHDLRRERQQG
jgi:hypothetical protein